MDQLIEVYGKPEAIRLENGPALMAEVFVERVERHGVKLLFIQPGKPNQNAFIERFNRSFRQEVLGAWLFNAVSEVQVAATPLFQRLAVTLHSVWKFPAVTGGVK